MRKSIIEAGVALEEGVERKAIQYQNIILCWGGGGGQQKIVST